LCASSHTGIGGLPHAEATALKLAGVNAVGGTAYVTLEPCAHYGKTPPCSMALVKAKLARVVVALSDPDSRVDGRGIAALEAAGIEVVLKVEVLAAKRVMAGFLKRVVCNKPFVSLKVATSLDGRIALSGKQKCWLTSRPMRQFVHSLRSRNDALITGVGTVIVDDPELTCRDHADEADSPAVYVLDSCLRTPPMARIFSSTKRSVTILSTKAAPKKRLLALQEVGAQIVTMPADIDGHVDIISSLDYLGSKGVNSVLIEAGMGVMTAAYKNDIVDKIFWAQSSHLLGSDALPVLGALKLVGLPNKENYNQVSNSMIGTDHLRTFVKTDGAC
jgi:diaminohydroxyphosphoribosylaminopyrimidine deaminase/5-amino-6-(5-phosphoribosylamino)uracil reductase